MSVEILLSPIYAMPSDGGNKPVNIDIVVVFPKEVQFSFILKFSTCKFQYQMHKVQSTANIKQKVLSRHNVHNVNKEEKV